MTNDHTFYVFLLTFDFFKIECEEISPFFKNKRYTLTTRY